MPENQHSESSDDTTNLWCPSCKKRIPLEDPFTHVEFSPVGARLSLDGTFDWGQPADAFIDYTHMSCGTRVRIVSNAGWSEELGEYVDGGSAWVEIYLDGSEEMAPSTHEDVHVFSDEMDKSPETWGPVYATLMVAVRSALTTMYSRLESGR